uniref:Uncharacterized protein n=1 Tax=Arundo donax TaxID=35708 RepID=A0A0A9AB12_ARUDO
MLIHQVGIIGSRPNHHLDFVKILIAMLAVPESKISHKLDA